MYVSNKPSSTLRRGTVATKHVAGADGQPACGKVLKDTYRLSGYLGQYSTCPACKKLEGSR